MLPASIAELHIMYVEMSTYESVGCGVQMDRASILGDAIEYLKELLQRINEIHNELEAAKLEQSRSMPSSPTPRSTQGYPATVKEECPVLPNPESQPPRVCCL